ncbi:hypothetical protein DFQ30_001863 [Apophysomyces sp. BC1015]|nr:hypothetical protein DFQ30_001863 [Apophysomyces sp. BC1015]
MLFNWQVEHVCVVFEWWHIRSALGLIVSCLAVFAIAAAYEFLSKEAKALDKNWLEANAKKLDLLEVDENAADGERDGLLGRPRQSVGFTKQQSLIRSSLYALLVGLSFWLMLVFMSFNGFLMIAVVLGAGVGHFIFGSGSDRSMQCH